MGADSWDQWVPWVTDVRSSLEKAQATELEARGISSVEEAYEEAQEAISFCCVLDVFDSTHHELSEAEVTSLVGSAKPTHAQITAAKARIFDSVLRGESLCITAYENGVPSEVFFAGFTVD